jgi:nicotinamide mononucleotide adenylyltransferase
MRLKELLEEESMPMVVILPGRFQPPHPGHLHGYLKLVSKFGAENVYISMTDITNPEDSPLSYDERKEIFTKLLGVPSNKIIKVIKQYNVKEIVRALDLGKNTVISVAISKKDANEDRFSLNDKKDSVESYMRKFKQDDILSPYKEHCYVIEYPTTVFDVSGKRLNSASQLRLLFKNLKTEQKKKIFKEIYGVFDERLFKVFLDKFSS